MRPRAITDPRPVLLYTLAASADLAAVACHWTILAWMAKPLLAPLLALALVRTGVAARSLMPAGLLCAALGDIALLLHGTGPFVVGMAAFLAMQIFYIKAFHPFGSAISRPTAAAYAAVWLCANALILPHAGALAPAIGLYSAALITMAACARRLGTLGTVGGALFAVSDGLIGAGVAGAGFPGRAFIIMTTYVIAQALVVYAYADTRLSTEHKADTGPAVSYSRSEALSG